MDQDLHNQLLAAQARIKELEDRLNQQSDQLQFFVQHAPVAMAMFDKDLRYLIASEKYVEDWIGKRAYLGESHFELFPDMLEKWKETYRRCLKGVTETCLEDPFEHRDGSIDYIDWVTTPWYNHENEIGGIILYANRANDRVADKKKLIRLNKEIKQSKEKLESLVYALSHNLQEPLISCISALQIAEYHHNQGLFHNTRRHFTYLSATQKRMLASLEDFLAHTNLATPKGLHKLKLDDLINKICQNLRVQIEQKRLEIIVPSLPEIHANEYEIMALFQNIISNGIRYNNHDQPRIRISYQDEEDFWRFTIQDNGPGISLEKQKSIFELSRPINSEKSEQEMGIGLAFCRRIVKSLNGKIDLVSAPDQGTSVSFTLPKTMDPS